MPKAPIIMSSESIWAACMWRPGTGTSTDVTACPHAHGDIARRRRRRARIASRSSERSRTVICSSLSEDGRAERCERRGGDEAVDDVIHPPGRETLIAHDAGDREPHARRRLPTRRITESPTLATGERRRRSARSRMRHRPAATGRCSWIERADALLAQIASTRRAARCPTRRSRARPRAPCGAPAPRARSGSARTARRRASLHGVHAQRRGCGVGREILVVRHLAAAAPTRRAPRRRPRDRRRSRAPRRRCARDAATRRARPFASAG